uniref:helix-turn-helix domain-containing protein n=1 Tax=Paractinoplanes polyasparticus TaxID=2856853 RepID=UPI0034DB2656
MTATTLSAMIDQWCAQQQQPPEELARRARMYPGSLTRLLAGRLTLDRLRADRLAVVLDRDVQEVLVAHRPHTLVPAVRPGPPWRRIVDEALAAHRQSICGFADAIGMSRGAIFDVLRGARGLSPAVARHLVEQLGIDLAALLDAAGIEVPEGLAGRVMVQRWRKGWTQAQLAQQSGSTKAMISKLERSVLPRRADPLLRVCDVLGIEAAEAEAMAAPTPFGRAVQERMRRRGMNITQLAAAVGVTRLAAGRWLSGAHPRPQKMAMLVAVLGDPDGRLRCTWQQHRSQLPRPTGRRADGMPRGWRRTAAASARINPAS